MCNRLHSVEQRLSRWLLLCHDRVKSDELQMTQEFISGGLAPVTLGQARSIGALDNPFVPKSIPEAQLVARSRLW